MPRLLHQRSLVVQIFGQLSICLMLRILWFYVRLKSIISICKTPVGEGLVSCQRYCDVQPFGSQERARLLSKVLRFFNRGKPVGNSRLVSVKDVTVSKIEWCYNSLEACRKCNARVENIYVSCRRYSWFFFWEEPVGNARLLSMKDVAV